MNASELVDRLDGVRKITGGWSARCPAHEDHRQSLSISDGDKGVILKCHAGCDFSAIISALGLVPRDLFNDSGDVYRPQVAQPVQQRPPQPKAPPPPPLADSQVQAWRAALRADVEALRHVTEVLRFTPEEAELAQLGLHVDRDGRRWLMYPYRRNGAFTYAKGRALGGEKTFLRVPAGQASHLYGVQALEPGGTAIVTEGERDVIAARVLGLHLELGGEAGATVVSLPDGAKTTKPEVLEPLKSQARVFLLTDADGPGDGAADAIAEVVGKDKCRRVRLAKHKDLGDVLTALGPEAGLAAAMDAVRAAEEATVDPAGVRAKLRSSVCRFTATDLESPPPRQEFVLFPYIPVGTVTNISGPGGSSKTTLLTFLAVCRALGLPFFGTTVRRGKTVILSTEDGRDDYWRKLAAIRHELGDDFDAETVAKNILLFNLPGVPLRLVEADRGNYMPTAVADHLAAVLKAEAPDADLVVMETVSRLSGGVESNESLSILVEAAQRVCLLAGVAIVLVAHVSQEAGRLGLADQYAARGGSALGDNARSSMVLTRINEHNRKTFCPDADITRDQMERTLVLTHPKANGAQGAKPLLLERASTPFGPVLRPADLKEKVRENENPEVRAKLVRKIAVLTARGVMCTRNSMRSHADEFGVPRDGVSRLIDDAVEHREIEERRRPGRGGGLMLVPAGNTPLSVVPDDGSPRPSETRGIDQTKVAVKSREEVAETGRDYPRLPGLDENPPVSGDVESRGEVAGKAPRLRTLSEPDEEDNS